MKYVFFGSPRFAEIILGKFLDAGLEPAALVCNPDRPVGRKKVLTPPATKALLAARAPHVPVFQPEKPAGVAAELARIAPDIAIVAAYASIIPDAVLAIPKRGTVGIHPSLLPNYRGASPIQTALLNGERETGVSVYLMDAKMDHGPVIADETWPIADNEQYPQLEEELAYVGAALAIDAIPKFLAGELEPRAQDEAAATFTRKFTTQDGFVDEADLMEAERGDVKRADLILRTVNALTPEPGAWTMRAGKRTKLLAAEIEDGALRLTRIQEEGGLPKTVGRSPSR